MDLGDKVAAVIQREAGAASEALESLGEQFGPTLQHDAAALLKGWILLHSNIGMTLLIARLSGARTDILEKLAETLYRATVDVMTEHFTLMMSHADVPPERSTEVIRFVMRYMNRTSAAVVDEVCKELNRG
jgi:hypothetical protein